MKIRHGSVRALAALALVAGVSLLQLVPVTGSAFLGFTGAVSAFADGNCVYKDNLSSGETAEQFISRCRQGGINSVFPGEWKQSTLGDIEAAAQQGDASARTARKVLSSNEYAKFSLPYLTGNQGLSHSSGNSTGSYTVTVAADPYLDQTVRLEYGDGAADYGVVYAGEGNVDLQFSHTFSFPSEDYTFTQEADVLEGGGADFSNTWCIP